MMSNIEPQGGGLSMIEPKQETRPIQITINFESHEEELRFVRTVKDVEIKISGQEDSNFECKVKLVKYIHEGK